MFIKQIIKKMDFFRKINFTKNNGFLVNLIRHQHDAPNLDASHKVNNLEKRFLVWTGKYKNVTEVPAFVSQSTMERCRNRMRIKIANYMMVATAIGCIGMIYKGKQDAKKGITVAQQNRDWHAEIKAKHEQELAANK